MKILIVEDNKFKSDKLEGFLTEKGYHDLCIRTSYSSGLKELATSLFYDLILLDISLPGFEEKDIGGNFMPSGGKHFFSQLYLSDIRSKVIVVTLFKKFEDGSELEDLHTLFLKEYEDNYMGYVLFKANDIKWQEELIDLINQIP